MRRLDELLDGLIPSPSPEVEPIDYGITAPPGVTEWNARPLIEDFDARRSRLNREEMARAVAVGLTKAEPVSPSPPYGGAMPNDPEGPEWADRRFVLCSSPGRVPEVNAVSLDDEGSCSRVHAEADGGGLLWSRWHLYRRTVAGGRTYRSAYLCPGMLSPEERGRVHRDVPMGEAGRLVAAERRALLAAKGRRRASPSSDAGDWRAE